MRKTLLLLVTAALTTLASFGQIPVNNLLENATLLNSFPFMDANVRLDLATASTISPPGCPLGNYKLVYYKFTATNPSPAQLTVTVEDASGGTMGNSFAIVYTAPSLNVANETEFTAIASVCAFGPNTTIDLIAGTIYYILVHRNDAGALSNVSFEQIEVLPVPVSERDALIALYNSTNGDQWNNNTLWISNEAVGTWFGIDTQMIGGVSHVTSINLGGINLTGTIPAEIGNFPELTYLGLWGNEITGTIPIEIGNLTNLIELDLSPNTFTGTIPVEIGNLVNLEVLWLNNNGLTGTIPASFQNLVNLRELYLMGAVLNGTGQWADSAFSGDFPDLTALPLELLRMENNFFQFDDIVNEFATYQANIPNFIFNPQFTIDPPQEIASPVGEDIVLTLTDVPDTGRNTSNRRSGNVYQWFKDAVVIDGANASSYTILNAQNSDSGIYSCEITNPDVPGFIITRTGITVTVGTLGVVTPNLEDIRMYPNPVSDVMSLVIPAFSPAKLTLYDLSGRLILTQGIDSGTSQIDMSPLAPGMYVLRLETDASSITRNIIKK